MHTRNDLSAANNPGIKFEGFFLQMVMPGLEQRAREIVAALGSDWEVKPIGDNLTEFEVIPKGDVLSVKEAWTRTYYLRSLPGVVYAEPLFTVPIPDRSDRNHQLMQQEADPQPQNLNESSDPDWSLKQLRVFEAWSRFFPDPNQLPGHGIIIGHPDTGYSEHPEIVANLLTKQGQDFLKGDNDPKDELETPQTEIIPNPGHGTSTASIIMSPTGAQAVYPSGKGVTGVAPGAKLIPLRVSYSVVLWSVRNLAQAIEYAADQGAHVVSISMGTGFFNKRLESAVIYAQKRGVIVIAAAGNSVPYVVWPAAYDEVIAVAASNVNREIWSGSSRGSQVDVTAPGDLVWHARVERKNGQIAYNVEQNSGTSFATAAVAGVAALWLAHHGRDQLIQRYGAEKIPFIFNQILRDSCEKFSTWKPGQFGEGIVNAEKVLAAALPDGVKQPAIAPAFALQKHPPIDNGGLETFAHLFHQQISDSRLQADFVGTVRSYTKLQSQLAALLQTTEAELPKRLKEVGQELAFYFAVNPELYKRFAGTLAVEKPHPAQFETEFVDAPLERKNLEEVRGILLSHGVSEVLKTKIEK